MIIVVYVLNIGKEIIVRKMLMNVNIFYVDCMECVWIVKVIFCVNVKVCGLDDIVKVILNYVFMIYVKIMLFVLI